MPGRGFIIEATYIKHRHYMLAPDRCHFLCILSFHQQSHFVKLLILRLDCSQLSTVDKVRLPHLKVITMPEVKQTVSNQLFPLGQTASEGISKTHRFMNMATKLQMNQVGLLIKLHPDITLLLVLAE